MQYAIYTPKGEFETTSYFSNFADPLPTEKRDSTAIQNFCGNGTRNKCCFFLQIFPCSGMDFVAPNIVRRQIVVVFDNIVASLYVTVENQYIAEIMGMFNLFNSFVPIL